MGWYAAGSIPDLRHLDPSGTLHIARLTPQLDRGDSCRAERSSKEAAMNRAKLSAKGLLLISGIGVAAAALAGPAFAAVQPSSGTSTPTTVVIRGSDPAAAEPSSAKDTPPTVLRGTPPAAAPPPAAQYACPSGYDYDPSYGCVTPGYAYNPYDYGDWPYYGSGGFSSGGRRHGFSRGFGHDIRRGFAPGFGRHLANGFGRGFAHAGGFGQGFAHAGGFGHGLVHSGGFGQGFVHAGGSGHR
jgi:hypothetical protein